MESPEGPDMTKHPCLCSQCPSRSQCDGKGYYNDEESDRAFMETLVALRDKPNKTAMEQAVCMAGEEILRESLKEAEQVVSMSKFLQQEPAVWRGRALPDGKD